MAKDNDSDEDLWMDSEDSDEPVVKKKPAAKTPSKSAAASKDKKDKPTSAKTGGATKGGSNKPGKKEEPPKAIVAKTEDQIATEEEGKRLRKRARTIGTFASSSAGEDKSLCEGLRLKPSAAIRKHSTTRPVEVFKKASMRKNKALFLFPGLVSVVQEGKMGQVHDLDKNPTLDIDFPTGRLRLRGTYVHPEGKFLSLQPKGKRIVAQDVFEQIVVFSEHVWLGPADKDPTGSSATVPNDAYKMLHTRVMYEGGASCGEEAALGKVGKGQLAGQQSIAGFFSSSQDDGDGGRVRRAAAQNIKYRDGDEFDDGDDDDEDEEDEAEAELGSRSPVSLPIPAIPEAAAAKFAGMKSKSAGSVPAKKTPVTKKDVDEELLTSGSDSDSAGSDAESLPVSSQKPARASAAKKISYAVDSDEDSGSDAMVISSDGGPNAEPPANKKKNAAPPPKSKAAAAPAKKATPAKKTPVKEKKKAIESDSQEESESESESEESEDEKPKKKAPPKKAATKKSAPAKKSAPNKKKKTSDSEDESESEPPSDEDSDGWAP